MKVKNDLHIIVTTSPNEPARTSFTVCFRDTYYCVLVCRLILVSVFSYFFSMKSCTDSINLLKYFSIETHFVVTEYAYVIPEKCLVFVFAYMTLVKYLPIIKMAAIVNLYQQTLTGVRLRLEASQDND